MFEVVCLVNYVILLRDGKVVKVGFVEEVFFDISFVVVLGLCESGVVLWVWVMVYYEDGFIELSGVGIKFYLLCVMVLVGDDVCLWIKVSDVMLFLICLDGIFVLNVMEVCIEDIYVG